MLPIGAERIRKSRGARIGMPRAAEDIEWGDEARADEHVFRLNCFACGRSIEASAATARAGRCNHCGGTMVMELADH